MPGEAVVATMPWLAVAGADTGRFRLLFLGKSRDRRGRDEDHRVAGGQCASDSGDDDQSLGYWRCETGRRVALQDFRWMAVGSGAKTPPDRGHQRGQDSVPVAVNSHSNHRRAFDKDG